MDMPEGWKWLKEKANAERLEGQPFGTKKRVPEAVELMKEMAEIIEKGAELEQPWVADALKVLKKFREWK